MGLDFHCCPLTSEINQAMTLKTGNYLARELVG